MENEPRAASRITRITIGRLHNLGDYEHVRYEVTVEVGWADDPGTLLHAIDRALNDIRAKSGVSGFQLQRANKALSDPEFAKEFRADQLEGFRGFVKREEEAARRRQRAAEFLSNLAMASEYKDAKDSWDDDDEY